MEDKSNKILIVAIVCIIIGVVVGSVLMKGNMGGSQAGQALDSDYAEMASNVKDTQCVDGMIWDGRDCVSMNSEEESRDSMISEDVSGGTSTNREEGPKGPKGPKTGGSSGSTLIGAQVFSTPGWWTLPVCATSTSTCPGYGKTVHVVVWGAGGGGQGGESASDQWSSTYGGAGGVSGSAGPIKAFDYVVPTGAQSFFGTIGAAGMGGAAGAGGGNLGSPGGLPTPTDINVNISGALNSLVHMQQSANGQYSLTAAPYITSTFTASAHRNSGSPAYGSNDCLGGNGGAKAITTYGTYSFGFGGAGGHGGYDHFFPVCTAQSNNNGLSGGQAGDNGRILIQW